MKKLILDVNTSLVHFTYYSRKKKKNLAWHFNWVIQKLQLESYLTGIKSRKRLWRFNTLYFSVFFHHFFLHPHTQTVSHPSHYPPIRQVREELEGRAYHLDSPLSAPFHSAPPSRQLLGPSVKFIPLLISMLMPKSEREAAQLDACWGCESHAKC